MYSVCGGALAGSSFAAYLFFSFLLPLGKEGGGWGVRWCNRGFPPARAERPSWILTC